MFCSPPGSGVSAPGTHSSAIPAPVLVAYVLVMLCLMFMNGIQILAQDGIDVRKATVVGVSFRVGMGFQHEVISPEALSGIWRTLLGNGMTTGSIIEILLTLLLEMPQLRRRRRLDVTLDYSALPEIDEYLRAFASRVGWDRASTDRLRSAGEETLF